MTLRMIINWKWSRDYGHDYCSNSNSVAAVAMQTVLAVEIVIVDGITSSFVQSYDLSIL